MSPVHAPDRVPYTRCDRPLTFYVLATLLPWALWLPGAWFSHQGKGWPAALFALAGLLAPLAVAWWITRHDPDLQRDMVRRVWDFRRVRPVWTALAVGLMPGAVVIATALSLLFGYSPEQFLWRAGDVRRRPLRVDGTHPGADRGARVAPYGTDSAQPLLVVHIILIFAVVWALWHAPLALFAGSSQSRLSRRVNPSTSR